ncbi:MAG: BrnT family toxin [Candidatus Hydrogenedentes bacterium]|nr:BrnT family toxin [Candidatus Hydrogenedentota bacterium]
MALRFEWDPDKADSNESKHGVRFEESLTVFSDGLARIHDDLDHSANEHREIIVGYSSRRRLLLVCFAARGDRVRIVSARKTTKRERLDYEEHRS